MSTKTSMRERISPASKKAGKHPQTLKVHDAGHKHVTASPAKEVVLISKGDIVEVTVKRDEKAKGQKRTSPIIISSPGQKAEKERSATNNNEMPRSWGSILAEQNLLYMKGQASKNNENKKAKVNSSAKRLQQNHVQKHTGTISLKRTSQESKRNPEQRYVYVQDRAVQCPEINNANIFAEFNPIHTLNFLMKELKNLVTDKDDKICEICIQMEQALLKIPAKPLSEDLEKLNKLEAGALQLKESSKKVKTMYKLWASEHEKYESLIQEQDAQIKEANQKQAEFAKHAEMLTKKLEETTRVIKDKNDAISALKRQMEKDERIISDLKTELIKQTELAQSNDIYLMEKEKFLKLFSYKDNLIIEYKNTIIQLQNQIEKLKFELKNLNEVFTKTESTSSQASAIQAGFAYSSPTSSFSDQSGKSWNDLSNISAEDAFQEEDMLKKDTPIRDSEFVSLLDGESSHTIMPEQSQVVNDKGTVAHNSNESNIVPHRNVNDVIPKRCLHHSSKNNKENDVCKIRKFSRSKDRQKDNTKNSFCHNTSKILESVTPTKLMVPNIRKQGYDMHNRIPVNVPSPLRNYPSPDWSESSLPSVSMASGLNIMPSNDI